jgi:hypothetical protein
MARGLGGQSSCTIKEEETVKQRKELATQSQQPDSR